MGILTQTHDGLRFSGSQMYFTTGSTNGSAAVTIATMLSTGNLGLGTTSPGFKLDVVGGTKSTFYTSDGGRGFKQDSVAFVSTYSDGSNGNSANDIGSTSNKWRDGHFSGTVNAANFVGGSGAYLPLSAGSSFPLTGDLYISESTGANIILNSNTGAVSNSIYLTEGATATPLQNGARVHYDGATNLFKISTGTTTLTDRFTIARDTGDATFSGDVRLPNSGKLYTYTSHDANFLDFDTWQASASAGMTINNTSSAGEIIFNSGNALALTLDDSQDATFAGTINSGAITSTGTITTSNAGGIIIDTTGNALLTLDGAVGSTEAVIFKHAGAEVSRIAHSNSTSLVFSTSAAVTAALTLSSSQNATFAGTLTVPDNIYHTGDPDSYFGFTNNDQWRVVLGNNEIMTLNSNAVTLKYAGATKFITSSTGVTVTGKVHGVTAGTASSDAVTLQQLEAATTGVLQYQGTWNASTNSPALASGVGTTGYYYIVSVGGSTNLDGITDWVTGDWAIFTEAGVTDEWQKIDNTSVLDGGGNAGSLSAWSGTSPSASVTLQNAPITYSGNNLTAAGALDVVGVITADGGLNLNDNDKIKLGTSGDLEIYHDGSNSYIKDTGTGNLEIRSNFFKVKSPVAEDMIWAQENAAVSLFYDNIIRLATSSTGIVVSGVVKTDYGTAALPSHTFTSDSNTGMYRAATDTLAFSTNALERMRIDGSGKVIVGTTSNQTQSKLTVRQNGSSFEFGHLNQSGQYYGTLGSMSSSGAPFIAFSADNSSANTFTTRGTLGNVIHSTGGNLVFAQLTSANVANQGLTERMRLDTSGNLGIGTTSPGEKLTVVSSTANTWATSIKNTAAAGTSYGLEIVAGGNATDKALAVRDRSSNDLMTVLGSGNVGIGTVSPVKKLEVVGTIRVKGGTTTADFYSTGNDALIVNNGTNNLRFWNNGAERIRIDSSGNVGIGTTSPATTLDVVASDVSVTPNTESSAVFRRNGNNYISILSNASNEGGILFGNASDNNDGAIAYAHNTQSMQFSTADAERMRISSDGNLMLGDTGGLGVEARVYSVISTPGTNSTTRYAGYFLCNLNANANTDGYGIVGVAKKLGQYGSNARGVVGIGKFDSVGPNASVSTNLFGTSGEIEIDGSTSTYPVQTAFALYSKGAVTSDLTNYYGLYIAAPTGSGTITKNVGAAIFGNVGIGTNSPATALDVVGSISTDDLFMTATAAGGAGTAFVVNEATQLVTRTAAQVLSDIGAAPATGGSYLPLSGGAMSNTNLVSNMNADLFDSLNSNKFAFYNALTFADSQEATTRTNSTNPAPGRATNPAPNAYARTFNTEFKGGSSIGSPGGTGWKGLISMAPYNNSTNFYTTQIAFRSTGTDDGIYYRQGTGTTWGSWTEFLTVANSGTGPFLPLSAGSSYPLSGDLYLKTTNDATIAREQIKWQTSQGTDRCFIRVGGSYAANGLEFGSGNAVLGMILHTNAGLSIGTTVATVFPPASGLLVQGNVGIGTTSPSYLLDVSKSSGGTNVDFRIGNTSTAASSGARSIVTVASAAAGDPRLVLSVAGIAEYNIGIDNSDSDKFKIGNGSDPSAGTNFLTIDTTGNVGIGTTSPGDALVVKGGSAGNIDLVSFQNSAGNETHRFYTDSANDGVIETVTNAGVIANLIQSSGSSYFNGGNVGIGTTSPSTKAEISQTNNDIYQLTLHSTHLSTTSKTRIGNWASDSKLSTNYMQSGGTKTQDDATKSSWVQSMGAGGDNFDISRSPAGSTTLSSLMRIDSVGSVSIGTATVATANAAADNLVIKGEGTAVGLTISNSSNAGTGTIFFGDVASSAAGGFRYNHNTGDMAVSFEDDITFANNGGERMRIVSSGNVGIGTTSPGYKLDVSGALRATGESTFTNNLLFPDNSRIKLGTGDDLQIYHDGSHSYIYDTGTGRLRIRSSTQIDFLGGNSETLANFIENGAIKLYYNNVKKFETTSTGIEVDNTLKFGIGADSDGIIEVAGSSDLTFKYKGGDTAIVIDGGATKIINHATTEFLSDVVLGGSSSIVLDDQPTASTTSGSGTIVNWTVSVAGLTIGNSYVVKTDGTWSATDADGLATSNAMLGIALATNANAGMLLQGFFYKAGHTFTIGAPLYLTTTPGIYSNTAPTAANDFVRIIGYATSANYIYFNPDSTWVAL